MCTPLFYVPAHNGYPGLKVPRAKIRAKHDGSSLLPQSTTTVPEVKGGWHCQNCTFVSGTVYLELDVGSFFLLGVVWWC